MDFNQFRQHHPIGSRVGDPLLIGNGETEATMYQCVSLVKAYWTECYGIVVNWPGDAIDLWNNTNPGILTKFNRVGGNDAQAGDIVVFHGLAGNSYGHVGIATGQIDGVNVEILEQNGATGKGTGTGGDAIRTRWVSRSRVAGLLRPIEAVHEQPPAPGPKYVITETYEPAKKVRLNKQPTMLWGMNYDFDYMVAHPVEQHEVGEIWEVSNKVHHADGYDYYRRPGQVDGFNVADCDDYSPPPAPAPAPAPQGAYTVPSGKTVTLHYDLRGYNSATQAGNLEPNIKQMVPKGTYNVHRFYADDRTDLVNVKSEDGSIWAWVNTKEEDIIRADNERQAQEEAARLAAEEQAKKDAEAAAEAARKQAEIDRIMALRKPSDDPAPAPEPTPSPIVEKWQDTYKPFVNPVTGLPEPHTYKVNMGGRIWNLDEDGEKANVFLNRGDHVNVYGTVIREGQKHYRLKLKRDTDMKLWICVPQLFTTDDGQKIAVLTLPAINWLEKLFHRGEQLKSIFTDGEPKWIDSVQLNPFSKPKKVKRK